MPSGEPRTWILTGSIENLRVTREHGFRVVGMKERRPPSGRDDGAG